MKREKLVMRPRVGRSMKAKATVELLTSSLFMLYTECYSPSYSRIMHLSRFVRKRPIKNANLNRWPSVIPLRNDLSLDGLPLASTC